MRTDNASPSFESQQVMKQDNESLCPLGDVDASGRFKVPESPGALEVGVQDTVLAGRRDETPGNGNASGFDEFHRLQPLLAGTTPERIQKAVSVVHREELVFLQSAVSLQPNEVDQPLEP